MKFENVVFVECNPDKLLLQKMGVPKRKIVHAGSKSEVCKRLGKSVNSAGVVDEDPFSIQPRYIRKLKTIESSQELGLRVLLDKENNNFVILLSPRLEEWIVEASKEAKVSLNRYGLPRDGNDLHKVINSNLDKFERLLEDLIDKSGRFLALKSHLLRW
ncbi:MAG: hypothetical protein H5T41_09165 [Methanomassiliicoccales archaeon]|nr:hypothetical protein [Methanomassiliicoccales archaeon]